MSELTKEVISLIVKTDQHLSDSWEYMADFRRIAVEGPNGSEDDVLIMKMACGLIFVANCSSQASVEGV